MGEQNIKVGFEFNETSIKDSTLNLLHDWVSPEYHGNAIDFVEKVIESLPIELRLMNEIENKLTIKIPGEIYLTLKKQIKERFVTIPSTFVAITRNQSPKQPAIIIDGFPITFHLLEESMIAKTSMVAE